MNLLSKIVAPLIGKGIGNLPLVTPIWYLVWRAFGTSEDDLFDVQGFRMYTDPKDSIICPRLAGIGCWEPTETEIFKKLVKPGMTVVDIGANIGYYSLMASRLVGETGKVYAFEPFERTYGILNRNIEVNGFKNITALRKAVLNRVGTMTLHCAKYSPANVSITETGASFDVPCTTIDHEFEGIKIDVIKMDIEGAEALVLAGMQNVIRNNPNLILITEVYPRVLEIAGSTLKEYVLMLYEWFDVMIIDEKRHRLVPCGSREQAVKTMSVNSGRAFFNLLCTRRK